MSGITDPPKSTKKPELKIVQGTTTDELLLQLSALPSGGSVVWVDSYTPPGSTVTHAAIAFAFPERA